MSENQDETDEVAEEVASIRPAELQMPVSNLKRYLPKEKRVVIPFVIPWESTAAKQTQAGTGGFGKARNAVTSPTGGKEPEKTKNELNSESMLTFFAETNKYASQKGTRGFGGPRTNVVSDTSTKEFAKDSSWKNQAAVIPLQSGTNENPSLVGETPIGAHRRQVPRIKYKAGWQERMDPESETFVGRQLAPNPNNKAGTAVIDIKRAQVPTATGSTVKHSKKTEGIVPKLLDTKNLESPKGTGAGTHGLGLFRQVITPTKGGYTLTTDEIIASKRVVPWITQPDLDSQAGTGGFQKTRDVVSHVKYRF